MASIMISSFSKISVKNNDLLMPVLGSWAKNETGSVIISNLLGVWNGRHYSVYSNRLLLSL